MAWESTNTRCLMLLLLLLLSTGVAAPSVEWGGRCQCGCCWCTSSITTPTLFSPLFLLLLLLLMNGNNFFFGKHFSAHSIIGKFTAPTRAFVRGKRKYSNTLCSVVPSARHIHCMITLLQRKTTNWFVKFRFPAR